METENIVGIFRLKIYDENYNFINETFSTLENNITQKLLLF
jgi:hypothetical protein